MSSLREHTKELVPAKLRSACRSRWHDLQAWLDQRRFPFWLARECQRSGKRAVVIWRPYALGDVVCTLPLAREIRRRHPDVLLVFITSRGFESVIKYGGVADFVYGIQHTYGMPSWIRAAASRCRGRIEHIYEPLTSDERVAGSGVPVHLIDDLASSCGFQVTERQPRLTVPDETIAAVRLKYDLPGGVASPLVIGINCGRTWPVREWEAPKWQQLIDSLGVRYNAIILQFGVVLPTGGPDLFRGLSGVRRLIQTLRIDELASLVSICDLVISIDSGPVHLAGAVGTPVVGLFGAVAPQFRLPPESPATGVFHDVPCLFCHHRTPIEHWKTNCPYDIRCMAGLQIEPVLQAIYEMLSMREGERERT